MGLFADMAHDAAEAERREEERHDADCLCDGCLDRKEREAEERYEHGAAVAPTEER